MKIMTRIALLIVLALVLFGLPTRALAQTPNGGDGKVVLGGTYNLAAGETLNGSLAIFGGEATLEKGSRVNGDIFLSGGTLSIQGETSGSIAILGGAVFLSDTAVVNGDITTIGGSLNRAPGAVIKGNIVDGPTSFTLPRLLPFSGAPFDFGRILDPFGRLALAVFQAFVMAAIALLVAMFLPHPTERVASSIVAQPAVSGGLGLLTTVIAPALLLLLAITIILIPVSLVGILALLLAIAFGWIALGLEIGQRMAVSLFHTTWTVPVAAGVGTLALSLISNVAGLVPCFGWLFPFIISIVGLGGVLASRFGTQIYSHRPFVPSSGAYPYNPSVTPTPPQPPVSPSESRPAVPPEELPAAPDENPSSSTQL
jgi:hypothetical protein